MKKYKEGEPRGITILITGPMASGKSTIKTHIKTIIAKNGYNITEIFLKHTSEEAINKTIESHDVTIVEC